MEIILQTGANVVKMLLRVDVRMKTGMRLTLTRLAGGLEARPEPRFFLQ